MTKFLSEIKWEKFTFVQSRDYQLPNWAQSHFLVPTPFLLSDGLLRVYGSFLNSNFVGRIGWIDVDLSKDNPKVVEVSQSPFLDVGAKNSFSEYGTGMGFIFKNLSQNYLGYVGFSRPSDVKFRAFSDLIPFNDPSKVELDSAINPRYGSDFGGKTITGFHDLLLENETYIGLFSLGNDFELIADKPYPRYQVAIATGDSLDSLKIVSENITPNMEDYYRIGRPRLTKVGNTYELLVTAGHRGGAYQPFVFYSGDLINWEKGDLNNFTSSTVSGFDDLHQCYLSKFFYSGNNYVVYNGNYMGKLGFGIAREC